MSDHAGMEVGWPVPAQVKTLITCKQTLSAHVVKSPWGFNIADHVGDSLQDVQERRQLLTERFDLPAEPFWLQQVHGKRALLLDGRSNHQDRQADASVSFQPGQVCAVSTADCLPVLFSDSKGQFVAAAHAGWQGLQKGVLAETLLCASKQAQALGIELAELCAYIGPAISMENYQVGEDLLQTFLELGQDYQAFFRRFEGAYYADLKAMARYQLASLGVRHVVDSGICTYADDRFYSYRRAHHLGQAQCGRFVSLIWLS